VAATDVHLFSPRPAYRFIGVAPPETPSADPVSGQNPPYGATINYWLKSVPAGEVTLTVLDPGGAVVRTLPGSRDAGLNRVVWNLRGESTRQARIRVSPLYAPEIVVSAEGMPAPGVGSVDFLVPPGTYTVKLSAGGREFTRQLEVRKDPNSGGSVEGIRAQTALLTDLQKSLNGSVDMINQLEQSRGQLVRAKAQLGSAAATRDLVAGADSLEQKLVAVEDQLHQLKSTGRGQDGVRWPIKLAGQLGYLASTIVGSDETPTGQAREAYRYLEEQLVAVRREYERVLQEVERYNARLRARNVIVS